MTKEYTPEEIKYRLSDLGVQIGNIAINYITELEKSCDETQKLLDKQIEATYKLDKENAELKKELEISRRCWQDQKNISLDTNCSLYKAKEIIRDFLSVVIDYIDKEDKNYSFIVEAEQFLNSEEEK